MTTAGKQMSEETKAKISAAMKGRKRKPRVEADVAPEAPVNPGRPYDQRKDREI